MSKKCFYDLSSCSGKLSREHLISASVLAAVSGDASDFTISFLREKLITLPKGELVIKDVCERCNSTLSDYDQAGVALLQDLAMAGQSGNTVLSFDGLKLGWVIKTHLNSLRASVPKTLAPSFKVNHGIRSSLINKEPIASTKFWLLVQNWKLSKDYWSSGTEHQINYFDYRAILEHRANIWISGFRIGHVEFLLLLPSNNNYWFFGLRAGRAIRLVREIAHGFLGAPVNLHKAIKTSALDLGYSLPEEYFNKRLVQAIASQNLVLNDSRY